MAKRKFHEDAKYAPRGTRLLQVGRHQMGSSIVQGSVAGVVGLQRGLDHWELSNDPQNTSTSLSASPAPLDCDGRDPYETNKEGDGDPDNDLSDYSGNHWEEEEGDQGIYEPDQIVAEALPPKSHDNSSYSFDTGPNIRLGIDLLHLCTETQVPLHFYNKVLQIFKEYSVDGSENSLWCNSTISSREYLLKQITSKIDVVQPVICTLESTQDIVTKFPFLKQLLDLF
jgi:hypothetical protein